MLKVGMIGTGNISNRHMEGWAASPDAEVVAGMDSNPFTLTSWGRRHGVTRLTSHLDEILADPGIDIVDICTPNMSHAPLAIAALEAGKHVIVEKPLAPTPEEVRRMIAARDAAGRELMCAQHYRFSGLGRAMKAEIGEGALGPVYHARSWMLRRNAFINSPTFVQKAVSGGGACIDIGVHVLDLTLWLMGNPRPVTVSGFARTELARLPGQWSRFPPDVAVGADWDVEEFAGAFIRLDTGATLMLEVSWALHHEISPQNEIEIWLYGRDGGCHFPSATFLSSNYRTRQHYRRSLAFTDDPMEPHALECVEFARALAAGAPSPVPAEQSLDVMAILDGIYRSQAEGREVRI
jgi:predicted dehydrogenase